VAQGAGVGVSDDVTSLFAPKTVESYGTCQKCNKRPAEDERGWCKACHHVASINPGLIAAKQAAYGAKLLNASGTMLRWPWQGLHDLTGPLLAGSVIYVVAASGIGKTTFALDLIRRWLAQKVGMTVLPLETSSDEWRLAFAAISCGVEHGDVLEMVSDLQAGDASVAKTVQFVQDKMLEQGGDPELHKLLYVTDYERVTIDTLDMACAVAVSLGHKVVLVDHIDHIGVDTDAMGKTQSGMEAIKEVNNAVLRLAKQHALTIVCMSQANMSVQGDGTNPLARFRKLEMRHVMYSSLKVTNAAMMLGVFRPMRPNLTRDEVAMAREGAIEPMEVLQPGRMGISCMKLRHRGRNEGRELHLHYEGGQLRELTEQERAYDVVQRSLHEQYSHMSPAYRQRRAKDGSTQADRGSK
jgi:KaiC/GvpD/RAD55 family RecA-like ATPase